MKGPADLKNVLLNKVQSVAVIRHRSQVLIVIETLVRHLSSLAACYRTGLCQRWLRLHQPLWCNSRCRVTPRRIPEASRLWSRDLNYSRRRNFRISAGKKRSQSAAFHVQGAEGPQSANQDERCSNSSRGRRTHYQLFKTIAVILLIAARHKHLHWLLLNKALQLSFIAFYWVTQQVVIRTNKP